MRKKHQIEDILVKGEELFREQGYNNTGIEQILRAAGIPKGSFYNFFDSKEDFAIQVLDYYGKKNSLLMENQFTNLELSPLERIKLFYRIAITSNVSAGCKKGCLIANLSTELGGINDNISQAANRNTEVLVGLLAACIEAGQAKGEIINTVDALDLANYINDSFSGALVRMKAEQTDESMRLFYRMIFDFIKA